MKGEVNSRGENRSPRSVRGAFTTIELLVVIGLIAILAALIFAGVSAIRGKEHSTTTQTEIREMNVALENFKAKYSIYPPSQLKVGPAAAGDAESQRILQVIWPNLSFTDAFGPKGWNLTGPVTLSGDQCLVLFLGGVHDVNGCQGFSTSKINPFQPSQPGVDREQPFFKFKPNRLTKRNPSSPFCSYGDGYFKNIDKLGKESYPCYAYFAPSSSTGLVEMHCATLTDASGNFAQPYKDSAGKYINRQSFQIVSSGNDLLWGKARQWESGKGIIDAASDVPAKSPGGGSSLDNISNFAGGLLSGK